MPCQTARPDGPCRNLAGATGPCASGTAAARRTAAAPRQHDRTCPAYRSRNTAPSKPGRRQTDTPTPTPRRRRQPATACGDRTRPASIAIVEKFLNSSCRHSFDQATPGGSSRAALRRLDIEAAANPQTCPIRLRSGAGSESTPSPTAGAVPHVVVRSVHRTASRNAGRVISRRVATSPRALPCASGLAASRPRPPLPHARTSCRAARDSRYVIAGRLDAAPNGRRTAAHASTIHAATACANPTYRPGFRHESVAYVHATFLTSVPQIPHGAPISHRAQPACAARVH